MRKLILFVVLLAINIFAFSQVYLVETFTLSATGREYGIYTDIEASPSFMYYLYYDMQAPNDNQEVQSKMSFFAQTSGASQGSSMEKFIKALNKAKETYSEWKNIAQSNSLKLLTKKLPVKANDQNLYFTQDGKWYSENGVDMWFTFFVNGEGKCFLIFESDYMTSSEVVAHSSSLGFSFAGLFSNPSLLGMSSASSTIKVGKYCSGASLTFSSEEEIDTFIEKLNKVVEWKLKNVQDGALLKK